MVFSPVSLVMLKLIQIFLQNSSTWNLGKHQLQEATEIMLEN